MKSPFGAAAATLCVCVIVGTTESLSCGLSCQNTGPECYQRSLSNLAECIRAAVILSVIHRLLQARQLCMDLTTSGVRHTYIIIITANFIIWESIRYIRGNTKEFGVLERTSEKNHLLNESLTLMDIITSFTVKRTH